MAVQNPIVLCEPQCFGFEHAPVNAALLGVFQHAFPGRELVFISEQSHGQCVSDLCNKNYVELHLVTVQPPARNLSHIKRFFPEKKHFAQIVALAKLYECQTVVFTSLTETGYFLQKRCVEKDQSLNFINFLHGMLQTLQETPPWKPWKKCFWFPALLQSSMSDKSRFFVYGDSIRSLALQLLPTLTDHPFSLDHPFFFHTPCHQQRPGKKVRIGALGIGGRSKGTHLFFELAKRFKDEIQAGLLEFTVIGPIFDKKIDRIPEYVRVPSPDKPLERDGYEQAIRGIDYALYLYDPNAYTLTASGAFMDAIAFAKPIIALENPFFTSHFNSFGDIGYLCSTFEDIHSVVQDLLSENNLQQRYVQQVQNILHGRENISLQALGNRLKHSLESHL